MSSNAPELSKFRQESSAIDSVSIAFALWLATYSPTKALVADAVSRLAFVDAAEVSNDRASASAIRLQVWSYPLTLAAMALVVFGFGHLLSHPPQHGDWCSETHVGILSNPFDRSLILIVGLSLIDLVLTVLVTQANAMQELNPIGSRLVSEPIQLIAFKVLITFMAVVILHLCRNSRLAQHATWWSCLVLTLVATRWLIFNSMFVA